MVMLDFQLVLNFQNDFDQR